MAGVNTLADGVKCNNICPISLQDTSRGVDHVIKMYDGKCYYTKYIYTWIVNLIRKGYTVGHDNFVFPNKSPITLPDLKLLFLNPAEFPDMIARWKASPAYAIEQARIASEYEAAATELAAQDNAFIDVIPDGNGKHEVDSLLRWGVQMERDEVVSLPIEFIKNVDHFLLPPPPPSGEHPFDHNEDENIATRRIRNIGLREIEYVGMGNPVPPGIPLVIRYNDDIYNSLEELAVAMGKPVAEIRGNTSHLAPAPSEGGRRRRKTRKTRKRRRTRRY